MPKEVNKTAEVDTFMSKLDYPFKAEVQHIRDAVKKTNKEITEQIKWNAPCFSFQGEYLFTFSLHAKDRILLIFHGPFVTELKDELLTGDYPDGRRIITLAGSKDALSKTAPIAKIVTELTKRITAAK